MQQKHPRSILRAAAAAAVIGSQLIASVPLYAQTAPTQPTTRPATRTGGVIKSNGRLMINFQDASIDVVLDELSSAAGFIVVKEVKPEGRVTLVSKQPIAPDEAVSLLNTVLRNAGYAAIQQDRILKIVSRDAAKRLNIPVHSGNRPEDVANTDELITQVIPLRYSDATQLKTDLQPLINPDADFTANASSNVLIITDTSANVRRVVQIVAALDTSVADSIDVKVYPLKHAIAADAAKLINDVFGNLNSALPNGGGDNQGGGFPGGPGGFRNFFRQQQQQSNNKKGAGKVTAASDDRTNSVVVSGPADSLQLLDGVIKQLDSNPADAQTVYVYRLRNAQAINLESVLNALFNGTPITNRNVTDNATRLQQARNNDSLSSFSSSGNQRSNSTGNGNTNSGYAGRQNLSPQAQKTGADLAGQVTVIAETGTNSLLIQTAPSNYDRVKAVLDELDKPVQQVLIKVLFAEVTHDQETDIGAEISALNMRAGNNTQTSNTTLPPNNSPSMGTIGGTNLGIPVTGQGLVVQLLETNFTATIRALETAGKLDVLSRPYILASDNQLATITVGQEVPFVQDTRITDSGQQFNTNVYKDIGILLDVIPHINPDGLVILDVAPEISSLTSQTVALSDTVSQPVIAKRSAQSRVSVKSGQTIVIGGLMQDQLTESVTKVPLLGDIPLLGELFKRTNRTKTKTELLIFLTPHVAASPDVLDDMAKDEVGGTHNVTGAIAPGVYQEHMDNMKRGEPKTQPTTQPMPNGAGQ
ncbi:MAG: type II secretion system secretin GspD [Tepidisphaeraceae bacterium]